MPPLSKNQPTILEPGTFSPHTYTGGCHCGRVKFSCTAPPPDALLVRSCNCSFCTKRGALQIFLKPESLEWTTGGWDALTAYRWNSGAAGHSFCPVCGIHVGTSVFGVFAINVRCIDDLPVDIHDLKEEYFDGKNEVPLKTAAGGGC
ncbi:hypothetical protein AURDEDRAFT_127765 [Auricularia subglabra TFB-10046 SS5]|nr:hypothetical protein AURDEDRAFT_127765 [Auricularia subglabra TFB-10046 SS5]